MLSLHFEQSFYRRLLNSGDPLLWRCRNKDLVVVLSSLTRIGTNWKAAKISIEIILASRHCDLCAFAGTHDFGWFLVDLLSGHVSTIILMQKCDSKYWEVCSNRAFIMTRSRKNITKKSVFVSGCSKTSCCVLFTVRWDNVDFGRICGGRERDSEKQLMVVGSLK